MKRLHLFVLRSFVGPLVLTFFIVIFLLLMQFLWKYIDVLAGKGLSSGIIAELLLYTSASLVPMALPLAILLAALMTFGNLGENYELTAIKSAGISLQRIMIPLMILVGAISLLAFFFSNNVMPYSNLKMRSLIYDISRKRPSFQITEGVFYSGIEGYSIKIGRRDNRTNILYDIKIYDHTEGKGNLNVTIADSGFMKMTSDSNLIFTLYHGYCYNELSQDRRVKNKDTHPHRRDKFEVQDVVFSMTGFDFNRTDETLFKTGFQMMNLKQLSEKKDSLLEEFNMARQNFYRDLVSSNYFRPDLKVRRTNLGDTNIAQLPDNRFNIFNPDTAFLSLDLLARQNILSSALNLSRAAKSYVSSQKDSFSGKIEKMRRHEIEWHRKFTLSIACLIFFFIGAPLGAIIRKGGLGMPVVVSVLFFVFWYVISLTGEKFAREDIIQAYVGMWLSSFILLPLGIFLTYKATTDSTILNIDTYTRFFKKIGNFLKINDFFPSK